MKSLSIDGIVCGTKRPPSVAKPFMIARAALTVVAAASCTDIIHEVTPF